MIVAGALVASGALAGSPRYQGLVLSDSKDGAAKSTFKPATAKIFLRAKLADVPAGAKVRADWIAEKTQVAPPNYRIDQTELTGGATMNQVTYSLSKPDAGWPTGKYRVDLFINGRAAGSVPFSVVK